uniref:Cleft lip and palate associated transmembrane protein n=1 Tax=Acrobeloides nanus TaxID=290746 RepID=A0A914D4B1_9BILA
MDVAQQPADQANGNQQQPANMWETIKSIGMRILFFYLVSTAIRGFMSPQSPAKDSNGSSTPAKIYAASHNMFGPGQQFDFYMYLSPHAEKFSEFDNKDALFWIEKGLFYGDWTSGENGDGSRTHSLTTETPEVLKKNGSLFLHVFIVKSGKSPVPTDKNYAGREKIYGSFQLNKHKKKHYKLTSNLLTGETAQTEEDRKKAEQQIKFEVLNYWHPNLTVNLVNDYTVWTRGSLPSPLDEAVKFDPISNTYYPILFFNNYWNLGSEYTPINETVPTINLTITYSPLSLFKWQLYASQQMRGKWSQLLSGDVFEESDDDQDTIKQALLETNPYLLGITMVVSILHTVLEFLAFKNDIQFWRTRKSLEGLSVRSVLFNMFQSLVVFLYICDNEASWVVKLSIGVGLLIELWKIPKVLNVEIKHDEKIFGIFPKVAFSDKGSYVESSTKEFDQMAFKYLSWLLFPLLGCYAVYSLSYNEYRSWYSWILGMLYGFLLTFGFITMTPQLFINYKLKSVAHLPWRMLTYKFINTFIDDLFAFVIRMPTLYRIGCFRDDIIFLIYIYQRWIYRVDPKRVNEFGTSMEHPAGAPEEENLAIEGTQPAAGPSNNQGTANEEADQEPKKTK